MDVLFASKEIIGPGFHGIRQYNGPIYGDGNSYNLPTQNLYDTFRWRIPEEMPPYLILMPLLLRNPMPQTSLML